MTETSLRSISIALCAAIIALSVPLTSATLTYTEMGQDTEKDTIISEQNVKFEIKFNEDNLTISVAAINENNHDVSYSSFNVAIDGYYIYETTLNLSSQEEWTQSVNITDGLSVITTRHTVTISTVGSYTEFNFTREINTQNHRSVPTPYIQNVEVTNGTIDGEPSAVAKVTVANPSIHPYPLKLMVHTIETDGSFYGAAVPPGENRTITVELLDERGSQIAGEARLYAGNLSQGDGAMDQIGFAGRAGEDTKTWNETYEPIEGPWRSDSYEYRNETYEDDTALAERISGGYEIFGIPVVYFITGLVAGLVLFRRIR